MSLPKPVEFCLGLHLHQPVGNFTSVFEEHLDTVYQPLLSGLTDYQLSPVSLHVSGPLLDWLEANASSWIDQLGRAVTDGRIELLAAGNDEPILVALSSADRVEQVQYHRERLLSRFGYDARGLWLTERVWEPDLPSALAEAGIEFAVVDDHHLRLAGIDERHLDKPVRCEYDGKVISLLGIDERLRYLIPFRPVDELETHFRGQQEAGASMALLADDGEKFGGWPGTFDWVWEEGWFSRFAEAVHSLQSEGVIVMSTMAGAIYEADAQATVEVPPASYKEMERWALPAVVGRQLNEYEASGEVLDLLTVERGQWRNFLSRYPESRRLHDVVAWLSEWCRADGNDPVIRRHLGRAQCNDAYWHGVFGGAYLPFLRSALWSEAASAARLLQRDAEIHVVTVKSDEVGEQDDVMVISRTALTLISLRPVGAVEAHLELSSGKNLCDVMSRHEEAYHPGEQADELDGSAGIAEQGTIDAHGYSDGRDSIHDMESALTVRPPLDTEARALFVDRWTDHGVNRDEFIAGRVPASIVYASGSVAPVADGVAEAKCLSSGLDKSIAISSDGSIEVIWNWQKPVDLYFTTELSISNGARIDAPGAERWEYPIDTVEKREGGFAETVQGTAVVLRWSGDAKSVQVKVAFVEP